MVRAGVGLPALMKLLGHVNPEMTMRYVEVASTDLQREFHLARRDPGIWRRNRKPPSSPCVPDWMASRTPCCLLNTPSRCSAARYPTVLSDITSTAS